MINPFAPLKPISGHLEGQLGAFKEDMRRDFKFQQSHADVALQEMNTRAGDFFDRELQVRVNRFIKRGYKRLTVVQQRRGRASLLQANIAAYLLPSFLPPSLNTSFLPSLFPPFIYYGSSPS